MTGNSASGHKSIKPADFDTHGNNPRAWFAQGRQVLSSANLHRRFGDVQAFGVPHGDPIPAVDPFLFRRDDSIPGMVHFWPAVTVWAEWMLRGFAAECLLKGLWLCQGHQLCIHGKYRGVLPPGAKKKVTDHELAQLADAVGFTVSADEREKPLQLWTFSMIGLGRYPVASNAQVMPQFGSPQLWPILVMECMELGDSLVHRLESQLESAIA